MTEHDPEYGPRHVWGSYVSTDSVNRRPIGRYTDSEGPVRGRSRDAVARPARSASTARAAGSAPAAGTATGAIGLATA
ncbi:hypothetical protein NVV95_05530 [Herbiconiux sp. CPCC 205716]|uniref:Uncharacterized protein n=1 Tax=Herbiconiux gentiana TaxID=2970912 RepID=A0ABT2GCR3_9MICO|nr:hypothetical protein [Herbiconiux gentiana]MCS5714010.1 hypothetical protein [Herbiconiux gentiana]